MPQLPRTRKSQPRSGDESQREFAHFVFLRRASAEWEATDEAVLWIPLSEPPMSQLMKRAEMFFR